MGSGINIHLYNEYGIVNVNGKIDETMWENAGLGDIAIRFYINDTYGNLRTYDIKVIKIADLNPNKPDNF